MNWHKGWSILALVALISGLLPVAIAGAQGSGWDKVDPLLLDRLQREGKAEFHVVMAVQADLSAAAALRTKVDKTTYVLEMLRDTAAATQAPLLGYLKDRGVPYQPLYIYNAIRVEAGATEIQWLASRDDVARIVPSPEAIPDPVYQDPAAIEHAAGIEWNVTRVHAPDVWNMGYRGEGMVLADNDTGAEYTHPALVNQYRGNLGGGNFDHNYNWWNGPGSTAPFDSDGHGTHTMGTMVGDDGGSNQVGVAPGAKWIACGGLNGTDPVDCFQFFLSPWDLNGQNPRPDLAPDAINNSWYDPSGYDYRPIIQNLNAAGIAVIKSAGNNGSACNSISNPGYVPEIIATAAFANGDTIASFSSRGPSSYYGDTILKPEVAAPGVNVRSSYPGSTYTQMSGTSMAAPHSTALVALIWNAAPCIRGDVPLTKQIMMETAEAKVDAQCAPFVDHPNDVWGWGILDDQAAVQAAMGYCGGNGYLNGLVTDSSTGNPVVNATVTAVGDGGSESTQTDPTGYYTMSLAAGTYTVTVTVPHYEEVTVTGVVIEVDAVTTQNFQLVAQGRLLGYVADAESGAPLAATITIVDDGSTTTDPGTGYYELYLEAGTYTVVAQAPDYISETATVNIVDGQDTQQDFDLLAMVALVPDPIQATVQLGQSTTLPGQLLNHMNVPYPFEFIEIDLSSPGGPESSGGPDPFGYTYKDSNEPDGPRYEWVDATDGTALGLADDGEANVTMPFAFNFYGASSVNLRVGNNGGLIFDATSGDLAAGNADLGTTTSNNLIVPFWDDIDSDTGDVYYKTVGVAPVRQFVIEWYNRPHYSNVGSGTFELVLYEGTNNIKYQYQDVVFGNTSYDYGASATVGTRQSGSNYLQYSFNQPVLADGMSICFQYPGSPPCDGGDIPWYDTSLDNGTVPANGALGWTNYFTATPEFGIDQPGDYQGRLLVYPTTGGLPAKTVAVLLAVLPAPSMGYLEGTVTGDRPGGPLEATILIESGGVTWTLPTDPDTGYYSYWLEAGAYNVTAGAPGYVDQTAPVQIIAQQVTTRDFQLELLAPEIVVTPQSLAQSLPFGSIATQLLTIANDGLLPLEYEIQERAGEYIPPRGEANTVLLMGDDLTAADWDTYRTALNFAGATWDEWDLGTAPFPTADQLAPYETLIWVDNDVIDPGDVQCQIVADWLVSGEKGFFAAGRDFLWDLANGTPGAGEYNLYLLFQTTYLADYAGTAINTLDGIPGDMIGDDFVPPNGLTLDDTLNSDGDYADENSPAPTGLIYGPGGAGSGHAGLTHLEAANYKLVWLGVNFHNGLTAQDQRNQLMHNVMTFLSPADVPWLAEDPITGTVAPGAAVDVDVVFDAGAVDDIGDYTADLRVRSNDPLVSAVEVLVTLTVEPGPDMGRLEGTVTGMGPCDGDSYPLQATVQIEGASGSYTLTTNPADGSYSRWLLAGSYTVTAGAVDHLPATTVAQVIAQQTTTADLALRLDAPCLEVTPQSFSLTLPINTQYTEALTLDNSGAAALVWEVHESTATGQLEMVTALPGGSDPLARNAAGGAGRPAGPAHNGVPLELLVDEGFEAGAMPPADWELLQTNPNDTWKIMLVGTPYQGAHSADCEYDDQLVQQDEVLFSPEMVLQSGVLDFWSFGSIYWCRDTYDNCDLNVWIVRGDWDGGTVDDVLVGSADDDWTGNFIWSHTTMDLTPLLPAAPVRIAFQYIGLDGAQVALDAVQLNGELGSLWTDVPWVGEAPEAGAVPPGGDQVVDVVFNTTGLTPGECYGASLGLVHDDANQPSPVMIPLNLCVGQEPPVASFTSDAPACLGEDVTFTNTSLYATSYLWAFGDGITSTLENPTHLYTAAGSYPVTLEATNDVGTDSYSDTVEVLPLPQAGFEYGQDGLTAAFTNTSLNATDYLWAFGDGITSTEANPVHTYAVADIYTVTLAATGGCGSDEYGRVVGIGLVPVASFTSDAPACLGEDVTFVNTSLYATSYLWAFGDGITSTLENPTHLYTAAGSYPVTLEATNDVGTDSYSDTVEVLPLPEAGFTVVSNMLAFTFTNTSLNATAYLWTFGDTFTSTEVNPAHTYAAVGSYTVTLAATGDCGTDLYTMVVEATACQNVAIIAITTTVDGCAVSFTPVLTGDEPFAYLWDFGTLGTSTAPTPTMDFEATGTYTVTLEVTNCFAGYESATFTVDVTCAQVFTIYLPLVVKGYTP